MVLPIATGSVDHLSCTQALFYFVSFRAAIYHTRDQLIIAIEKAAEAVSPNISEPSTSQHLLMCQKVPHSLDSNVKQQRAQLLKSAYDLIRFECNIVSQERQRRIDAGEWALCSRCLRGTRWTKEGGPCEMNCELCRKRFHILNPLEESPWQSLRPADSD